MKEILVETSARHVHVTQETLEVLFGEGYQLTVKKMLSQPGQFASNEKVKIVGPKGELNASILGPVRNANQVELSLTDARACKLVGPKGEVELSTGVIAAKRHIHMTEEDAKEFGVKDKDIVNVEVHSNDRSLVFGDVVVRVSNKFALAMHVDTDESNAAALSGQVFGKLIK